MSITVDPSAVNFPSGQAAQVKIPELLAPVGNFETFMAALDGGADAVYLGLKKFSARARAENFTLADLELMTLYAHQRKVKIYVTLNTLIRNDELSEIYTTLNALLRIRVDAVIVQDLGLVNIIRRDFPALTIHLSTQLAIHNAAGVDLMAKRGCKRVVLGRELTLDEISQVAQKSSLEIELFVYGALCVSVAGLCQFSSFFGGQSANRGRCSQPCRRPYRYAGEEGYFFSPADFNALEFLPELIAAGVASCKIEGRMKGSQYVKVVVSVFRRALDKLKAGDKLTPENLKTYKNELQEAYARPTTPANLTGYYPATIIAPKRAATIGVVIGKVRRVSREGGRKKGGNKETWRIILRSTRQLSAGDRLKVVRQGKDGRDNSFTLKEGDFKVEKKRAGKGAGNILSLGLPFVCQAGDLLVKVGSRDSYGRRGSARIRRDLETAVAGFEKKPLTQISQVVYRPAQWLSLSAAVDGAKSVNQTYGEVK
ncbi:MAG: U32 family peptidase, partial [Deltaproteobacteria bacterium]|nr:U32 family peptidase [Deltaproteobacteria bacterium]